MNYEQQMPHNIAYALYDFQMKSICRIWNAQNVQKS